MQTDKYTKLIPALRQVVGLLVEKKYDELESMTGGQRLTSAEMRQAVEDYGGVLTMLPKDAWERLDVIEVKNCSQPTFSVRFNLWVNGKQSDLSIEGTFIEIQPDKKIQVEIDDLHVL